MSTLTALAKGFVADEVLQMVWGKVYKGKKKWLSARIA